MNSPLILTNYFLKMHLNVILPPPRLIVWYMQIHCNQRFTHEAHCAKFVSHLLNKNHKQTNFLCERTNNTQTKNNDGVLFFALLEG
jgi:hypothetical protein